MDEIKFKIHQKLLKGFEEGVNEKNDKKIRMYQKRIEFFEKANPDIKEYRMKHGPYLIAGEIV